ncbi:NAD(P)/FAD-dependent oxidoreductase [Photobacterium satsumensis]|uniref:NAD(P)/FAD-dependent oxidoreductase n=1 Tax=Photobacterium satsumensis TaxID=2910239 RepID=UPI003D110784
MDKIVIIGAGRAGVHAAFALREQGFNGRITVLNEEPVCPYDRPPLSKQVLLGEQVLSDIELKRPEAYANADIGIASGCHAVQIDREQQVVQTSDGKVWPYDKLLVATGGAPRKLPKHIDPHCCVNYLRTSRDAYELQQALFAFSQQTSSKGKVAIIGAGVIGLEVAAVANQLGLDVTVIERAGRIMSRLLPLPLSRAVQSYHEQKGVLFHLSTEVNAVELHNGSAQLILADGSPLKADIIVAGLGMLPETEIAQQAGVHVQGGIVTSAYGQTSDEAIYCAGDVSHFYHPVFDDYVQVESWQHAQLHGENAAMNILGKNEPYKAIPWMWSDQYDRNLQVAGMPGLADSCVFRDVGEGNLLAMALKGKVLVGAIGFGNTKIGKEIRIAQKLIEKQAVIPRALLQPAEMKLKPLLKLL